MIPKVIHYCWFGDAQLTPLAQKCISSWKKYCVDFEIKRWDETNFDINSCNYVKQAYSVKKWAFVSDYARFKILYEEGGIYFDTDVELVKPLDDLLMNDSFMACESNYSFKEDYYFLTKRNNSVTIYSINSGLGMGFCAGNRLLKEIIDYYSGRDFLISTYLYDKTTVGDFITRIMVKKGFNKYSNEMQVIELTKIYPKDFFSGKDNVTGELEVTTNTRAIHHGAASWMNNNEKKIVTTRKMYKGKGKVVYVIGFLLQVPEQFKSDFRSYGIIKTVGAYITRIVLRKRIGIV